MLESGSSGSVRGVLSNEHPYREPGPQADIDGFTFAPFQNTDSAWYGAASRPGDGVR